MYRYFALDSIALEKFRLNNTQYFHGRLREISPETFILVFVSFHAA